MSAIEATPSEVTATGGIRGIVRDASGEPLSMANAAITSLRMGAATAGDGAFVMRGIPAGSHTLTISHGGLRREVDVDVVADSVATVDVTIGNSPEH